jgi:3-deoxy-D-manno-octulosonate 8-phosphate phosphatase (KDO 8-P phosphatase)
MSTQENIADIAKQIKLVIFDVDGVFTNGDLYLTDEGTEIKTFHSQDGIGIRMLKKTGVKIAVITARQSKLVEYRMQSLGVEDLFQAAENKFQVYEALKEKYQLTDREIAMVGDDLPDLKIIMHCGLGIAVANAQPIIKQHACYITTEKGGKGAVREVCEMLMKAQGSLDKMQMEYWK